MIGSQLTGGTGAAKLRTFLSLSMCDRYSSAVVRGENSCASSIVSSIRRRQRTIMGCLGEQTAPAETLPELYYRRGKNADCPLPEWAKFLQCLGVMVADRPSTGRRAVVAVALPTRAYAAILVASGVTLARAKVPVFSNDLQSHFAQLCSLPQGTKVSLTVRQKRHRGIFLGVEPIGGESWAKVQLTTGDRVVEFVSERNSANVEIEDWEGELPNHEKGKKIARRAGFLEVVFGGNDPRDFATKSRLDAVMLGSAARLQSELLDTRLAAPLPNGRLIQGTFQDLLRVRRLAPGQAFRSEIISDTSPDFEGLPPSSGCTAVFDGPRAFLKLREHLRSTHWIVLLDRTSAGYLDAVDALNQEYLRRQTDIPLFARGPGAPWGVEVMAFEEAAP